MSNNAMFKWFWTIFSLISPWYKIIFMFYVWLPNSLKISATDAVIQGHDWWDNCTNTWLLFLEIPPVLWVISSEQLQNQLVSWGELLFLFLVFHPLLVFSPGTIYLSPVPSVLVFSPVLLSLAGLFPPELEFLL